MACAFRQDVAVTTNKREVVVALTRSSAELVYFDEKRKCRVRDILITLLLNFISTPESGIAASLVSSGIAFSSALPIPSLKGRGAALLEQDNPGMTAIHDECTRIVKKLPCDTYLSRSHDPQGSTFG